jgi:signal transduction histidine kinase
VKPRSLRARLLAYTAGLTAAALLAAWVVLSALLTEFVTRRLDAELRAAARAVIAVSEWDETGRLTLDAPAADPRFERPLGGWYWQVTDAQGEVLARSASLLGGAVDGAAGPNGEPLSVYRQSFTVPGDGQTLQVTVTLPAAEAEAELAAIRQPLAAALAILAVALVAAQWFAVRAGLSDLTRFAQAVAALREGSSRALPAPRVAELVLLAEEMARLIAANTAQIERARAHAGDLAHALKTPLAVLGTRVRAEDRPLIARMEAMIAWHLRRARAAAAGFDPAARASVAAVFEDVALVVGPAARRRGVAVAFEAAGAPDFRGDAEDLAEMIGALAENAVAWARSAVRLVARGAEGHLVVEIADDGPGIPEAERVRLLARGARLDEGRPGFGLGLAIVADRVALYGGRFDLEAAPGGGLLAQLTLPAVHARAG